MGRPRILIKGGLRALLDLYTPYKIEIMKYNDSIRWSGYYVKPIHVTYKNRGGVTLKYMYFGRYWYRVSRRGGRVSWIYLGRDKPDPALPDPPLNPFEGLAATAIGEDVELDLEGLRLLSNIEKVLGTSGFFTRILEGLLKPS
jgi:hypothetical protein